MTPCDFKGANKELQKPVDIDDFEELIKEILPTEINPNGIEVPKIPKYTRRRLMEHIADTDETGYYNRIARYQWDQLLQRKNDLIKVAKKNKEKITIFRFKIIIQTSYQEKLSSIIKKVITEKLENNWFLLINIKMKERISTKNKIASVFEINRKLNHYIEVTIKCRLMSAFNCSVWALVNGIWWRNILHNRILEETKIIPNVIFNNETPKCILESHRA